jgi:hypothetical protein
MEMACLVLASMIVLLMLAAIVLVSVRKRASLGRREGPVGGSSAHSGSRKIGCGDQAPNTPPSVPLHPLLFFSEGPQHAPSERRFWTQARSVSKGCWLLGFIPPLYVSLPESNLAFIFCRSLFLQDQYR